VPYLYRICKSLRQLIEGKQLGLDMLNRNYLTQQDGANYTRTSLQKVNYVLNDLSRQYQIYFKRKSILIRDIANLSFEESFEEFNIKRIGSFLTLFSFLIKK